MIDATTEAGEWIERVSDILYALQRATRGRMFSDQWEDHFEAGLELADLSNERAGFGRMVTRLMDERQPSTLAEVNFRRGAVPDMYTVQPHMGWGPMGSHRDGLD